MKFEIIYKDASGATHWEQIDAANWSAAKTIAESKGSFIAARYIGGSATELEYVH